MLPQSTPSCGTSTNGLHFRNGPKTAAGTKENTKYDGPSFVFGVLKLDKVVKGGRVFKPKRQQQVKSNSGVHENTSPPLLKS